jgi:hypothetical protein
MCAFAAEHNGAYTSPDGRTTYTPPTMAPYIASKPASGNTLYNNIAYDNPRGLYFCCEGATISGPNSELNVEYWEAQGFVPTADSHATNIAVLISYLSGTFTDVILSLNADCSGVPCSTPLEQWTLTLSTQTFGSCCAIEAQTVSPSVSLTAGSQYWVVASTESDSDIWAAWNTEILNGVDKTNVSFFTPANTNWVSHGTTAGYVLRVSGTTP